jgi:hypothetical protein
MKLMHAMILAIALLAGCGGDSPSKIYGKWKQDPVVIEFTEKTFAMGPMMMKVAKYEMKDGKVTVFVEGEPHGITFSFKSDKEICVDGAAAGNMGGCFTKV